MNGSTQDGHFALEISKVAGQRSNATLVEYLASDGVFECPFRSANPLPGVTKTVAMLLPNFSNLISLGWR
tara:strand:- start:197 stop:406 length:210 start_codon:yes stop_codon:yes gene_type:complete